MTKNPYNMKRKWTVEVDQIENASSSSTVKEKLLEEKLRNIEKQFQEFQEQQNKILEVLLNDQATGKGKGRGKKSAIAKSATPSLQNSDFQSAVEKEAQRRLRSFIQHNEPSLNLDQNPSTSYEPSAPPPPSISNWTDDESPSLNNSSVGAKVTKTIFIKKVEVTLNGVPLDLVEDKETEDEVIKQYQSYINHTLIYIKHILILNSENIKIIIYFLK